MLLQRGRTQILNGVLGKLQPEPHIESLYLNFSVNRMKVLFLPDYSRKNPYQVKLEEGLKKHGVEVAKGGGGRFFPILWAIKTKGKPDVLHLHWTDPYLVCENWYKSVQFTCRFFLEIFLIKCLGIKLVWTIHNLFQHEKKIRGEWFVNKLLVGLSNQVIVHAVFSEEEIIKTYGLSKKVREKINIVPHGHFIDSYENSVSQDQARDTLGIDRNSKVFLYFGMIRPYKGIGELLNGFRGIKSSSANLLIVGEPKSNELKEEILKHAKSDERIQPVLCHVPSDSIQIYMNASDCVVFPFQKIFTSGSVLLAMSFGKAIIAPALNFLQEVLDPEGAILYKPDDPVGLQDVLRQALDADLHVLGKRNLLKAQSFGWDEIGRKTSQIYKNCFKKLECFPY